MKDEEKSKEQLLSELRALRDALAMAVASSGSERKDAAKRQGELEAMLRKSQQDVSRYREETSAGREQLGVATFSFTAELGLEQGRAERTS